MKKVGLLALLVVQTNLLLPEDEAKFLLQSTPVMKEEPVDVQLEPAVIAKLEQVGDGLVAVKPEPVESEYLSYFVQFPSDDICAKQL